MGYRTRLFKKKERNIFGIGNWNKGNSSLSTFPPNSWPSNIFPRCGCGWHQMGCSSHFMDQTSDGVFLEAWEKPTVWGRSQCVTWTVGCAPWQPQAKSTLQSSSKIPPFPHSPVIRSRVCSPLLHPAQVVQRLIMTKGLVNDPNTLLRSRSPLVLLSPI